MAAPAGLKSKISAQIAQSQPLTVSKNTESVPSHNFSKSANFSWAALGASAAALLMLGLMGYVIFVRNAPELDLLTKNCNDKTIGDAGASLREKTARITAANPTLDPAADRSDGLAQKEVSQDLERALAAKEPAAKASEDLHKLPFVSPDADKDGRPVQSISPTLRTPAKMKSVGEQVVEEIAPQPNGNVVERKSADVEIHLESDIASARRELSKSIAAQQTPSVAATSSPLAPTAPSAPAPLMPVEKAAAAKQATVAPSEGGSGQLRGSGDAFKKEAPQRAEGIEKAAPAPKKPAKGEAISDPGGEYGSARNRQSRTAETDPGKPGSVDQPASAKALAQPITVKIRTRNTAATIAQIKAIAREFKAEFEMPEESAATKENPTDEAKKEVQLKADKATRLEVKAGEFTLSAPQNQRSGLLNRLYALQAPAAPIDRSTDGARYPSPKIQGGAADPRAGEKTLIKIELIAE